MLCDACQAYHLPPWIAPYKNKKAYLPINPVTALPRPHILASPVRTNENRIGRHSVSSVKSIATVNQLLSDVPWTLCIFVSWSQPMMLTHDFRPRSTQAVPQKY